MGPRKAAGQKSPLGGIIYCKRCGARYTRQSNGSVNFYYSCYSRCKSVPRMIKDPNCKNKNYKAGDLDGLILGEINKLAIDQSYTTHLQETKPKNEAEDKIKTLRAEVEKIDVQISKMMDLYALGSIDLDVINNKVAALNSTKTSLNKEIESLNGAIDKNDNLTPEEVKNIAGLMDEATTLEQKRAVVQSLIYYIEIDGEDVYIHWKF